MTEDVDEDRVSQFKKLLEDFSPATEGGLNPFDKADLRAYVTALLRHWSGDDDQAIVADDSLEFDAIDSALAVMKFRMHDAAFQWVKQKFGEEASHELDDLLDDENNIIKLAARRDRGESCDKSGD